MFLKILLTGLVLIAAMVAVKDGRLLARAGLVGGCTQISVASDGASWQACKRGRLEDYPNLAGKSCTSFGVKRGREDWHCPAELISSQAPRA